MNVGSRKYCIVLCAIVLMLTSTHSLLEAQDGKAKDRPSVGLVLSGGGAKGVAHVGVIRVLEEAGVPIDYIAGTSMGSIVGGLYSIGYTCDQMDSLFRAQDWLSLLGDRVSRRTQLFTLKETADKTLVTLPFERRKFKIPTGLLSGQNVYNMLYECTIGYHDSLSYDKLPIPFACVAYDLVSGKDLVMHSGVLPTSIRASMSIPGAFAAVNTGDHVLVDGGMFNNYPVDVIKSMGADLVVGVDVSGESVFSSSQSDSFSDIFGRLLEVLGQDKMKKNLEMTDLYIHPHVDPYSAASFSTSAIDSLLIRGERAAREKWDEVVAFSHRVGREPKARKPYTPEKDSIKILDIHFQNTREKSANFLRNRIIGIKKNSTLSPSQIQEAVANLQGTGQFAQVNYSLNRNNTPGTYDLNFYTTPRIRSQMSLGLRMDTEDIAAIYLNVVLAPNELKGAIAEFSGRASRNSYLKAGIYYENAFLGKFGTSYSFRFGDFPVTVPNHESYTASFQLHQADLDLANFYFKKFNLYIGARYNYFRNMGSLYGYDYAPVVNASESIISYHAAAHYDSFDKAYFPTSGIRFLGAYDIYTDNFIKYNGETASSAISMSFEGALPVGKAFTITPSVHARMLFGEEFAYLARNFIGGTRAGIYMDQQLPFAGMNQTELCDNQLFIIGIEGRYTFARKHNVSLKTNAAYMVDILENISESQLSRSIVGAALGYGYESPFGPVEVYLNYCNRNKRELSFFVSLGKYF